MDAESHARSVFRFAATLVFCVLLPTALAEKLPVQRYTVSDGLAHDQVRCIVSDSRGYLWFCTYDGLSWFDGERFTSYGVRDGLPVSTINDLAESRDGSYWIATQGGVVVRFDPAATGQPPRAGDAPAELPGAPTVFTAYSLGVGIPENLVNSVHVGGNGDIWACTNGGLFRLKASETRSGSFERVPLDHPLGPEELTIATRIVEDGEGSLWVATVWGVARILPGGARTFYSLQSVGGDDLVLSLVLDRSGRLWFAHQAGLFVFKPDSAAGASAFGGRVRPLPLASSRASGPASGLPTRPWSARTYTAADGMPGNEIMAVYGSADGPVWVGTRDGGIVEFAGDRFRIFSARQGLNNQVSVLGEDRSGDLWVGTPGHGVLRIARDGLVSYSGDEGVATPETINIFSGRDGAIHAITAHWFVNRFDGEGFEAVQPNLPRRILDASTGRWWVIQDRGGEWWVATMDGLYRFPRVDRFTDLARSPPRAVYRTRDGLADDNVNRLFEDSRGDIWISSYNPPVMLTRWDRSTGTFRLYGEADGLPADNWSNVFAEDGEGSVWLGMHNGGLIRYREGRFERFGESHGVPAGMIQGLYRDHAGRLWVASSGEGIARIDQPSGDPVFSRFTVADGLSSNNARAFAEDRFGRIYVGTARGVDRLDPPSRRIRHYSRVDGLIGSEVTAALAGGSDRLWFGTREGLSYLIPRPDRRRPPPPIWIHRIQIDGVGLPLSDLGELAPAAFEISPTQRRLQIDVLSVSPAPGRGVQYRYRLDGAETDWGPPTRQRSIRYANLPPGSYRFRAQAIGDDGTLSLETASVAFSVLPPLWQRWWFVSLFLLSIAAAVYSLHRYRLRRLLEIEAVRTRIATDLHDDIGLSLSRMAILSEVVKKQLGGEHRESHARLSQIADSSREVMDSMSDIVWSIDPRRDDLDSVVIRLRAFAADVFGSSVVWDLWLPDELRGTKLPPERRRHLFLILKEALNNVARHAECRTVSVAFSVSGNMLEVRVIDDGRGFEPSSDAQPSPGGQGLDNMRARANELGGSLHIAKGETGGTGVTLRFPIR